MAQGTPVQVLNKSPTDLWNVAVPAGSNRIGRFRVLNEWNTVPSITATINGVSMTALAVASSNNGGGRECSVYEFYILEATMPAAGNYNIDWPVTGGSGGQGYILQWVVDTDCAQVVPVYARFDGQTGTPSAIAMGPVACANNQYGFASIVRTVAGQTATVDAAWGTVTNADNSSTDTSCSYATRAYSAGSTDTVNFTNSVGSITAGMFSIVGATGTPPVGPLTSISIGQANASGVLTFTLTSDDPTTGNGEYVETVAVIGSVTARTANRPV